MNPSPGSDDQQHLRLLSIFHYVDAGLTALFSCFFLIHTVMGLLMVFSPESLSGRPGDQPPQAFGWMFTCMGAGMFLAGQAMAVCTALAGRFIARRTRYWFVFVMACIQCAVLPFGTVLGVFTIIALSRESVKSLFHDRLSNAPMSSKTLFILGVALAWCFFGAQALADKPVLRFDGIYYRTGSDAVTEHLRFYPDGTVIGVATPVEKTSVKIALWFKRDWPAIAKGRYTVRGRAVEFTLESDVLKLLPPEYRDKVRAIRPYTGTIGPQYLTLHRAGEAEKKRYSFVKVRLH